MVCIASIGLLYYKVSPELPDVRVLQEKQLQQPGDEKFREPVQISAVPDELKNAIIAAEDRRFYEHSGVDYRGLLRAAVFLLKNGHKGPGGSTITMQVARNFFLPTEKTYNRKAKEIFLAFKIESELSKDEILELYINKVYLGNKSYGFGAAARVYYGKNLMDIELAEAAMLAGLPKAPARYNPIVDPERAKIRRNYVLDQLNELELIDDSTYETTKALPVVASLHRQ